MTTTNTQSEKTGTKPIEYKMELKGWKAVVVLAAGIMIIVNAIVTIPFFIALAFIH